MKFKKQKLKYCKKYLCLQNIGLSLKSAIVDAEPDIFAPGIIYVALSRVTNIDGLYLNGTYCTLPMKVTLNQDSGPVNVIACFKHIACFGHTADITHIRHLTMLPSDRQFITNERRRKVPRTHDLRKIRSRPIILLIEFNS